MGSREGGVKTLARSILFVKDTRADDPHHTPHTAYTPHTGHANAQPCPSQEAGCANTTHGHGAYGSLKATSSDSEAAITTNSCASLEIFRVPLPRLTTWGLARELDGMQEPVLMCLVKPVPPALNWLLATDSARPLPTEACVPSLKYETEAVETLCTRSYGPHGARTEALPTSLRRRRGEGREGAQVPHAAGASGSQRQSNAQQG